MRHGCDGAYLHVAAAMTTESKERVLGRLEGRINAVELRLQDIDKKLDPVVDALARTRGGWRMLVLVMSVLVGALSLFGRALMTLFGKN
jgi:hypothetical protein